MPSIIRIPITVRRTSEARSPETAAQQTEEQAQTVSSTPASAAQEEIASQPEAESQVGERQEPSETPRAPDPAVLSAIKRALEGSELMEEAKLQAFVLNLLEVGDNLERALRFAPERDAVAQGVELTWQQFLRALAQVDIRPIDSLRQPFNPHWHEAIAVVASKLEEGTVVGEEQRGYTYRQKLLRPARVIVSAGPAADSQ